MSIERACDRAIQRLAKWRTVFTGWQLGTRPKGDPEGDAVRDHREATILLRAEVNALIAVLSKNGNLHHKDFKVALTEEANQLSRDFEKLFPGIKATDEGIVMTMPEAHETTKSWRP